MRQLRLTSKKLRGIPRRLRALKRWSESFIDYFPDELPEGRKYMNWKIPVHAGLVIGKYSTSTIKAECAQRLIDACANLIHAKPKKFEKIRVTALISLPDMFGSEICLYVDEDYFRAHTRIVGETKKITNKSLSKDWGLVLPEGVHELGITFQVVDDEYGDKVVEQWFFGELV